MEQVEAKRAELEALTDDKDIFEFFGKEYEEGAVIYDALKESWYVDPDYKQVLWSSGKADHVHSGLLIAQIVLGRIENYIEDEKTKDFHCSNLDPDAEQIIIEMPATVDGRETSLTVGALLKDDRGHYICLSGGRITFPSDEELKEIGYHCDGCGTDYR